MSLTQMQKRSNITDWAAVPELPPKFKVGDIIQNLDKRDSVYKVVNVRSDRRYYAIQHITSSNMSVYGNGLNFAQECNYRVIDFDKQLEEILK